jgi:hypothetical protein
MECTAKIEIHGSTVGYWLHFIPNSLFWIVMYTGQYASKCYQKDAFKGVETCTHSPTASSTSMTDPNGI